VSWIIQLEKEGNRMPTTKEAFDAYATAWNTGDPETSRRLMEQALTEDALMSYPSFEARGWEGIAELMVTYKRQLPGTRIELTTSVEEHHNWVRIGWRMLDAAGAVLGEGEDVAEIASDGRFTKMIGFRNPMPPLGES
jgi:hypothetical protein